jgi:hypothetical protein
VQQRGQRGGREEPLAEGPAQQQHELAQGRGLLLLLSSVSPSANIAPKSTGSGAQRNGTSPGRAASACASAASIAAS